MATVRTRGSWRAKGGAVVVGLMVAPLAIAWAEEALEALYRLLWALVPLVALVVGLLLLLLIFVRSRR